MLMCKVKLTMRLVVVLIAAISLVNVCVGQGMVRQCRCAELEPCRQAAVNVVMPCADRCQRFAAAIGGNYQQIRNCIVQKRAVIDGTLKCIESSFLDSCARGPPKMVPRRYTTGLELAAVNEINSMLQRSGVAQQVTGLLTQGRRFFKCFQSCITKGLGSCVPDCGLDLPADNVLVQTAKQCAIRSGANTPAIQDLCSCMVRAGVGQLAGVCPRIQIFKRK